MFPSLQLHVNTVSQYAFPNPKNRHYPRFWNRSLQKQAPTWFAKPLEVTEPAVCDWHQYAESLLENPVAK
jgi:hypothetical protein